MQTALPRIFSVGLIGLPRLWECCWTHARFLDAKGRPITAGSNIRHIRGAHIHGVGQNRGDLLRSNVFRSKGGTQLIGRIVGYVNRILSAKSDSKINNFNKMAKLMLAFSAYEGVSLELLGHGNLLRVPDSDHH